MSDTLAATNRQGQVELELAPAMQLKAAVEDEEKASLTAQPLLDSTPGDTHASASAKIDYGGEDERCLTNGGEDECCLTIV